MAIGSQHHHQTAWPVTDNMVFTQGRGFVAGASYGVLTHSLRCRVLAGSTADTAALATRVLFGKLFGVATLFDFGEKRCRKNLPLSGTGFPIIDLNDLSTRALQFIGGGLFSRYCDAIGVHHPAVDELIAYIDSIAQSPDLYIWAENLCLLDVHGLGDLPPPEIAAELPYEIGGEFHRAVESLVEIYMADHMGAITENPQRFTRELLAIVSKHGVSLPDLNVFVQSNGHRSFGDRVDDATLQKWRAALRC